jgi:UDP-N-acetylmuramoyl-tripeptide--D-alanyl-D-alanine ligase
VTYKVGAPGRHIVLNSLAVLAATSLLEADLAVAALTLADLRPPAGRGAQQALVVPGGTALLIDESYNANPASMRAALALLGQMPMGSRSRRIAVLGDMLELGSQGHELHKALVEPVLAHDVDLVFCCGPLMRALWEALPSVRRGGYAETSTALESAVIGEIQAGDAIMVKGSLGSKMATIVAALTRKFSSQRSVAAAAQG